MSEHQRRTDSVPLPYQLTLPIELRTPEEIAADGAAIIASLNRDDEQLTLAGLTGTDETRVLSLPDISQVELEQNGSPISPYKHKK